MSGGLRHCLTAAFQLERRPSITSIPLFLAPSCTPRENPTSFPHGRCLQTAVAVKKARPAKHGSRSVKSGPNGSGSKRKKGPKLGNYRVVVQGGIATPEHVALQKGKPKQQHLLERVDRFLPLELRSKTWLENLASFEGVKDIRHLPELLVESRKDYKDGLLTHIALKQGRWPAAIFLAKALLTLPSTGQDAEFFQDLFSKENPWSLQNTPNLKEPEPDPPYYRPPREPTYQALNTWLDRDVSFSHKSKIDLHSPRHRDDLEMPELNDKIRSAHNPSNFFDPSFHSRVWLADLWYFLGQAVLRSMEMDRDVANRTLVHVADIVAEMHHTDHVSSRLYTFDGSATSSIVRKPPTLHLLESKILTTLSDAMWRSKELDTLDYSIFNDPEIAAQAKIILGVQPSVPKLKPELWMELILWSCVYGGFYSEAIRLLQEMLFTSQWRLMPWQSVENAAALHPYGPGGTSANFGPRTPERMKRMAGTTEGYGVGNEMVSLPSKHVSSEVVASIALGAANGVPLDEFDDAFQNFIMKVRSRLLACATADEVEDLTTFWYDVVASVKDRAVILGDIIPQVQEQLADLVDIPPSLGQPKTELSMIANYPSQGERIISLSSFISLGNLAGAKSILKILFEKVEMFHYRTISAWFKRVLSGERTQIYGQSRNQEDNHDNVETPNEYNEPVDEEEVLKVISADTADPNMHVNMPLPTLVKLYELAEALGEEELKTLLVQEDDNRSIMPYPSHRVSNQYRAIQFKQHFNNLAQESKIELLEMLLTRIDIGKAVPKQLLNLAPKLSRPDLAEQFLVSLRELRTGIIIWPVDIMNMAKTYLELPDNTEALAAAKSATLQLLDKMLSGEYDPPHQSGAARDDRAQRYRNQCRRILSSIPNHGLQSICPNKIQDSGRENAPTEISTEAFNTLLSTVVLIHGPATGQSLCETYCKFPDINTLPSTPSEIIARLASQRPFRDVNRVSPVILEPENLDQVVTPKLSTVQIVTRRALKSAKDKGEVSADVIRWAVKSFLALGMSRVWIAEELGEQRVQDAVRGRAKREAEVRKKPDLRRRQSVEDVGGDGA